MLRRLVPSFVCVFLLGWAVSLTGCLFYKAEGLVCGKTQVCSPNATCNEEPRCVCNPGYNGDGTSCSPNDDCVAQGMPCDANGTCSSEGGAPHCVCNAGYLGDGRTCRDQNECVTGDTHCSPHATCTNTIGSYRCECAQGWDGDGVNCTDIDECARGTANCSADADCTNTQGGFTCTCHPGYQGDGRTCTDVNECASGTVTCAAGAECVNDPGTYHCGCKSGYQGDGQVCTDIDECAAGTAGCHVDATCANTLGSFTCTCKPGFGGDGKTCDDIDECQATPPACPPSASCQNSIGSFTCTCPVGFAYQAPACADIDECRQWTDTCSVFADCQNTVGSFSCACRTGFSGNGTSCAPTGPSPLQVTIPPGMRPGLATIRVGWSVIATAVVTCPAAPCSYAWDFGNGQTSAQAAPPVVSYPSAGFFKVTLTVKDASGGLVGTGTTDLTVWDGTFTDNFDRASMDWDAHGWFPPLDTSISWDIEAGRAHVWPHMVHAPGSTGILAYPLIENGHVEATIGRTTRTDDYWFYTDILVREHPVEWNGKYYRLRVLQSDQLQLAIYRINHPEDEHGILINDRVHKLDYGPCTVDDDCTMSIADDVACRDNLCRPIQPRDVPHIDNWNPAHDQDIRIVADVHDVNGVPEFHVKLGDPSDPTDIWLEQTVSDGLPNPYTYKGLWGLTAFEGDARFDNFLLVEAR